VTDATAIATIWHEGWLDGHQGHVPDALVAVRTSESFHERAADRIGDTVVAVVDEQVVGFIMVVADEVEQVYVARTWRGTGVAAALLVEAERIVARNGHAQAWLAVAEGNRRARRFYHRNGWTDEGPLRYLAAGPASPIPVPCRRFVKTVTPAR
jgi:GNAT superfamily N-acetyltransferase